MLYSAAPSLRLWNLDIDDIRQNKLMATEIVVPDEDS